MFVIHVSSQCLHSHETFVTLTAAVQSIFMDWDLIGHDDFTTMIMKEMHNRCVLKAIYIMIYIYDIYIYMRMGTALNDGV